MAEKVLSTVFYTVLAEEGTVWLRRAQKRYKLAVCDDGQLNYLSPKPRPFLDEEDDARILQTCEAATEEEEIGTVVLTLRLGKKGSVEVLASGELLATWSLTRGIRFSKDAHPIFRKDKDALATACLESLRGGSGIFGEAVEGDEVFSPTNMTKL